MVKNEKEQESLISWDNFGLEVALYNTQHSCMCPAYTLPADAEL